MVKSGTGSPEAIEKRAGRSVFFAQRFEHGHQIGVALILQLADRAPSSLRIGLLNNAINQFLVEVRHVGELGPGPLQTRAKLLKEVFHAGLTTCCSIGLEQTFLPPT